MSDKQLFIDIPLAPQPFASRVRQSIKTAIAFIQDQRWASLIFLLVYLGLMYWEYQSVRLLPTPPPPDWIKDWPEFFDPIKVQLSRQSLGTWRSMLAGLVTVLYWGNALLYIADRAAAFPDASVVGLVRYLLRGFGIGILLVIPLGIGLVLLLIPGLLVAGILMAAAAIAMFRENGVLHAIGEGYRLVTRSLPGQSRILGFSRNFAHIVGAYGLVLLVSIAVLVVSVFINFGAAYIVPDQGLSLTYAQSAVTDLIGSFLNLCFSIFILKLYAEYRTFIQR